MAPQALDNDLLQPPNSPPALGAAPACQCCRMDDLPLLYPIGPAKAVAPLRSLARATGNGLAAIEAWLEHRRILSEET